MSDKWLNNIGTINESKKGNFYIKINSDIELKEGDNIIMKKKSDELKEAFEKGDLTEDRYNELSQKLSFIKYTLHKPPRNNS